jgi:plasmid replication initiation protein
MTLQELRFFSIYLAKINAKDLATRVVRFKVSDFQSIMELCQVKIHYLSAVTDNLLCKIVHVPLDSGGVDSFQLFKKCRINKDDKGEWYVEIDAHDEALPMLFEFKSRYFTYELWNALKLRSSNQLRMYEILKQYERTGERILKISVLKDLLGLNPLEYPRFGDFKTRVLDACKQALSENTDIKFTYEPYGKRGKGGKILHLRFIIGKNTEYKDQLSLDEFIDHQKLADIIVYNDETQNAADEIEEENTVFNEMLMFMAEACGGEFNLTEIQVLYNLMLKIVPYRSGGDWQLEMYNYLKRKYDELKWRASRTEIKSRLGYLKKIIEADLDL